MASPAILFFLFSLPLLLLAVFGRRWRRKQRLPLPPGPIGLPILGNLHLLGPLPHQTFSKLAEDYGPIMYLRLGLHPAVVITSPQAAEKILKTHDSIFASRPLTDTGKYLFYGQKAIAFTEYGPYWRNIRRISTAELLTTAKIESFGHLRREELGVAVHTLEEMAKTGGVVDLTTLVGSSIANVSCRVLFGRKYTDDELDKTRRFKEVIDESMRLAGAFNIAEFIPFLAPLDLQGIRRDMKAVSKVFDDFFEKVIDEHIQNRGKEEKNKDFVDIMLALMESRGNGVQLDKTNLKAIILDMVIGSTDTSAATVEWTMSELIKQPRVMKKLQEELLRVVGEDRMVNESDLPKLEYLDMVVKEAMRLHPVVPLLIPHVATRDCTIDGYFIPKGTRAFVNAWAIGRNPITWPEPEEFRPERFKGSSINASGHYYKLLPFGSGRRLCPGLPLGNIAVQLFVAQFAHCFNWELPNGMLPSELDMNEKAGLIVQRAHHLMAIPVTRLRHDTLKCI